MRKSVIAVSAFALTAAWGASGFAHGPQIQVTNDNNKITTRQVMREPYNTAPAAPTAATNVYVLPLAPISAFGGTEWFVQPDPAFPVTDPGVAWGYGWTYTDVSNYTMTFPAGSNIVQAFAGGLQQWNGSTFAPAAHSAQLAGYRSTGSKAISGSATPSFSYATIAAPAAADPDPHGSAFFQLIGDGIVPDSSHVPAAVDDGIYSVGLQLSLVNQPATADPHAPSYNPANPIQASDTFYFVMYKEISGDAALAAAQAAFPGASIQVVPEPATLAGLGLMVAAMKMRRRRALIVAV